MGIFQKTRTRIDPVCGMLVPENQDRFTCNIEGDRFYFCTEACRRRFQENPDKYLQAGSPRRKNWWRRYLERLNKATEGKSLKCH